MCAPTSGDDRRRMTTYDPFTAAIHAAAHREELMAAAAHERLIRSLARKKARPDRDTHRRPGALRTAEC